MFFFFFKQKTAYEIKECDWSSDVCSSDLDVLHEDNRKMCEYYTGVPVVACVADGDTELSMDAEDLKALYETAEK